MREPTAVVFDLDDTLYPERRFALSAYAAVAVAAAPGAGVPGEEIYRFLVARHRAQGREGQLQALCATYGLPESDIPRQVAVIRTHRPRLRLPRASREVLGTLRRRGHRLGILTNGLQATQHGKVAALGLAEHVDAIVYAEDCAPGGKPALTCFTTVLDRLGVAPRRAVFVGDHADKDVAGAAAAGLWTIWTPTTHAGVVPGAAHAVAAHISDVPELVAHLLEESHAAAS